MKRRPDTFFRLRVRYFLAPLRAWPVASSIAIAREKSTSKNQAKGRRSWLLTQALSRDPGARRDVRRYSIDGARFLSAATHRASFSLLTTCCVNFETDMSVFFIFLAIRSCPALISCFSSTAMRVAEYVNFPADKKPFCRGRLLHVDGDATCCGLRLEIKRLYTLRILTPETWRSRRRPAPCLFHIIVENDQAELKAKKLETADSSSLHVRTWPTVQHTRDPVVQCIQFFFSKTLFDFKKSISGLIELKFSGKTPNEVLYAPIYFWGVYF